ncbi:AraC family transcriptional regulator [Paenibacillus favisporus]|uniref:AraC family transcriptional regulator n=1 Tax=Paenibacillus favisporus TaxID=221028 RepID=UPI002DB6EE5E|nr:AraC family transcriptional regulator [Paenibacillus favisporus]MEC0174917.1 AraC family transcriptional regulator [Paenibacillus favisporus]
MDPIHQQFMSRQLAQLRVQLLLAKRSVCHDGWQRLRFTPTYDKLYYICDGEGWLQVGRKQLRPKPGELVMIPGGLEQSYSVTAGPPYTKYWCHFRSNVPLRRLFHLYGLPHAVWAGDSADLSSSFQELVEHRTNPGPARPLRIQSALLSIIAFFMERALRFQRAKYASVSPRELMETLHFIDLHLSGDLTIDELSRQAHFHPNYFIRMFKRHLGMTPMRYIQERRLEHAQQLLETPDLAITEIAGLSGFKDLSHFSAAFKKKYGASPTEYRNLLMNGHADLMPEAQSDVPEPSCLFENNSG